MRLPRVHRHLALLAGVAAVAYFWRLGRASFDDAEAYSAYIANLSGLGAMLAANLTLDPGKPGLYAVLLHAYCAIFGTGEVAVRSFSAFFGVVDLALVFILASQMFDEDAAFAAAAIWAFNPLILLFARWGRMYTLFIALGLGELIAFRRLQERPSPRRVLAVGILGGAMLLTHLGGAVLIAAEAAVLARDAWRGRGFMAGAAGLVLALIVFAPFVPFAYQQLRASVSGHLFDWIGPAIHFPLWLRAAAALIAIAIGTVIVFGPAMPFDRPHEPAGSNPEPMRWCAIWVLLPFLGLGAGSIVFHPMLKVRYVAPELAGFAILGAAAIGRAGATWRNRATFAIVSCFIAEMLLTEMVLTRAPYTLWRDIAQSVKTRGAPEEPVFLEAGYVMSRQEAAGLNPDLLVIAFPRGFLRVPFDYYYKGQNPRVPINPFKPVEVREQIARAAMSDGGAWLLSDESENDARAELPSGESLRVERIIGDENVGLYHIVPGSRSVREAP